MKKAVGFPVLVAVSLFASAAFAQMTRPATMGRGPGWGYVGPDMTLGMMFLWGIVIVGMVVGTVWLARQEHGPQRRNARGQ